MSSTVKNIVVVLVAFTVVFAGYYLYAQNKASVLSISESTDVSDAMLAKAQAFISHSTTLSSINLNMDIFSDPVFRSYRSYTEPVPTIPQGRQNPFEEIGFDEVLVESEE